MVKTLVELADLTGADWKGDPSYLVTGVSCLEEAESKDVSFFYLPRYAKEFQKSRAGIICVSPSADLIEGRNYLISADPSNTFEKIVNIFISKGTSAFHGIHPTAVIHPTVRIGEGATISPYAVVESGCTIGCNTFIGPLVAIGEEVVLGNECTIHAHVTIRERCVIGNRVIVQPNSVIGSCGFGYTTNDSGIHIKQEQLGGVVIEDDVEIGACVTIDRARFKETRIGQGTKIDNLVQIGHNVVLGKHNIIVAQTGISGSVKTGRHVMMGGQSAAVGHVTIADGSLFAARSGVIKSVLHPGQYGGTPAIPIDEWRREQCSIKKLREYFKRLQLMERELKDLKTKYEGEGNGSKKG